MAKSYYDPKDLDNFPKINEDAPDEGNAFFNYYSKATTGNKLSEREKTLIALAVSHSEQCPYCIDAYTNKCLSMGISNDEMMEAVHVASAMKAGVVLAHATQMKKIINKKRM